MGWEVSSSFNYGTVFPPDVILLDIFVGLDVAGQPPLNFVSPWFLFLFSFLYLRLLSTSSRSQNVNKDMPLAFLSAWRYLWALWPVIWGNPRKAEQRQKPLDIDIALCGQVHGAAEWAGKPGPRWLRGSCLGSWIVSSFVRKSRRKDRLQEGGNNFSLGRVEFELPAGHSCGMRGCLISHIDPHCRLSCQCPLHGHLAQPNSFQQASLSPGFYFPFQSILCCWINLPRARPQSYPVPSWSHVPQYTLPHGHITYYPIPRVIQYTPPQSHHRLP